MLNQNLSQNHNLSPNQSQNQFHHINTWRVETRKFSIILGAIMSTEYMNLIKYSSCFFVLCSILALPVHGDDLVINSTEEVYLQDKHQFENVLIKSGGNLNCWHNSPSRPPEQAPRARSYRALPPVRCADPPRSPAAVAGGARYPCLSRGVGRRSNATAPRRRIEAPRRGGHPDSVPFDLPRPGLGVFWRYSDSYLLIPTYLCANQLRECETHASAAKLAGRTDFVNQCTYTDP